MGSSSRTGISVATGRLMSRGSGRKTGNPFHNAPAAGVRYPAHAGSARCRLDPNVESAGMGVPLEPSLQDRNGSEEQGIERDGDKRPGENQVVAVRR